MNAILSIQVEQANALRKAIEHIDEDGTFVMCPMYDMYNQGGALYSDMLALYYNLDNQLVDMPDDGSGCVGRAQNSLFISFSGAKYLLHYIKPEQFGGGGFTPPYLELSRYVEPECAELLVTSSNDDIIKRNRMYTGSGYVE